MSVMYVKIEYLEYEIMIFKIDIKLITYYY